MSVTKRVCSSTVFSFYFVEGAEGDRSNYVLKVAVSARIFCRGVTS